MQGTSSPETVSTKLQRVAELARRAPSMVLSTIAHHIDIELLREAHRRTRKDGATGVDGQTAADYAVHLEDNLRALLDRFKSGTYRAPPVRRVHIPKGTGGATRPLGIPTFEDKVLQRAVLMVLEAVYEQDFLDCSYGFRPGRGAHDALEVLRTAIMQMRGGWVVEVDIQSFFEALDHGHLRSFLDQRVRDGVIRRQIDKWLKAGVLENGAIARLDSGSPQGGVISPLLANIYLHVVLDVWWTTQVAPRLRGRSALVRYADDFVIVCAREDDARRVMAVLPKRFGKYGLTLHPDKTRLVRFEQPALRREDDDDDAPRPATFDLLGFTHYWATSRNGWWVVKRRTARARFSRAIRAVRSFCRRARHLPVVEQWKTLSSKLRGHYGYYGITANVDALQRFFWEVRLAWRKWLDRRSRTAKMTWERFALLLRRYPLPAPHARSSSLRVVASPMV